MSWDGSVQDMELRQGLKEHVDDLDDEMSIVRAGERMDAFMLGYLAAIEDVNDGNVPPVDPTPMGEHMSSRCAEMHQKHGVRDIIHD